MDTVGDMTSSTISSTPPNEKVPNDFSAMREEIAALRSWTQKEMDREKIERQKEAKYMQNAVNILAQRSDAEIKNHFKLAEHVQELIGEAKRNVEAVCTECAKQQDSIKDLWGSVNMLSIMLRRDQSHLIRVQEWIMEAKRNTEKVRAECQKHERSMDALDGLLKSADQEFSSRLAENGHSKKDLAEQMAGLSKFAKQQLQHVFSEYEGQLRTTHELLSSITSLRTVFEKEQPQKSFPSQELDKATLNFMAVVVERDSGDGKGLVKVMNMLGEASKAGPCETAEQAEEWLGGVRRNLQDACRECGLQKQATSELLTAIISAKKLLNEQLQERIRLNDAGNSRWSSSEESSRRSQPVNWQVAIEDMMRRRETGAADEVYQADNSVLKASTPGLGFRNTPNLEDMDKEKVLVPWGSLVSGVTLDENWLKVGDRFLPKFLKKIPVLRPYQEPPKTNLGAVPSHGASSPRRASVVPDLQPIREGTEEDRQERQTAPTDPAEDPAPRPSSPDRSESHGSAVDAKTELEEERRELLEKDKQQKSEVAAKKTEEELRELVSRTVTEAFETLQAQIRDEAARALQDVQKESSLNQLTLQSTLNAELERIRDQIPNEITQCFAKNKASLAEQAADLKKSLPLLVDDKTRAEIEAVARKVFTERAVLDKMQFDRSVSPRFNEQQPKEVHAHQYWGLVSQLQTSGVGASQERLRDRQDASIERPVSRGPSTLAAERGRKTVPPSRMSSAPSTVASAAHKRSPSQDDQEASTSQPGSRGVSPAPVPAVQVATSNARTRLVTAVGTKSSPSISQPGSVTVSQASTAVSSSKSNSHARPTWPGQGGPSRMSESPVPSSINRQVRTGVPSPAGSMVSPRGNTSPAPRSNRVPSLDGSYKSLFSTASTTLSSGQSERSELSHSGAGMKNVVSV